MKLLSSQKNVLTILFLVFLALGDVNLMRTGSAQDICNMTMQQLMECRPSVTKPNPPPPTDACCAALKGADLPCFCSYKDSGFLPALGIDPDLAMQLPAKCGIDAPSEC